MRHIILLSIITGVFTTACSYYNETDNEETAGNAVEAEIQARQVAMEKRQQKSVAHSDMSIALVMPRPARQAPAEKNRENYQAYTSNPITKVLEQPVSTFSIDVDTSSYSNVRRILNQGALPNHHAVRVEEMVNYFSYDYPAPKSVEQPFTVSTEIAPSPWDNDRLLLQIGLKGYELSSNKALPPANLVFLVDVSGSMQSEAKLPLVKRSLRMLASQMRGVDTLSLVVYAGQAGIVLPPTAGDQKATIFQAIDQLEAGGSTNGEAGIMLAYQLAEDALVADGVNRIILCSDGDLNVGTTNIDALKQLVARKREDGISLTTLSFGHGNYNDELMEQIADVGNGNAAYIDTLLEAKKVLIDQMGGTLLTIAKDVKIQVEFNPSRVLEYRLIGYENRMLSNDEFNNDKVDAGDIGAGHTVTALYELTMVDAKQPSTDPLRYQNEHQPQPSKSEEIAFIKLRYKQPESKQSLLIERPVTADQIKNPAAVSNNFKLATAVAAFGQKLQGGKFIGDFDYDAILTLANPASETNATPLQSQFIELVELAKLNSESGV
ncbi:vWA domain-containing protein [Corallincola spongiicola]|nr:VWA domain-containing protein [Corallincola spongiicola]